MSNTYDTTQLSKEDLLNKLSKVENELQKVKRQRRYGLVWEERPEEVEKMFETHIPVLNEEENMKIIKNESKPHNLLLEGDNLHALNVLKRTHKEKVDVIYIDPPYNTGNKDFVYNDRYVDKEDSYRHSNWLSFMEKRLRVARELMSDEGVIFISIDDNEMAQLKLLCDQVFGEENFINNIVWRKGGGKSDSRFLANRKEYCLVYKKNNLISFTKKDSPTDNYRFEDAEGKYAKRSFCMKGLAYTKSLDYPIDAPDGTKIYPGWDKKLWDERAKGNHNTKDWCWTLSKKEFSRRKHNSEILFEKIKGNWKVYYKSYLKGKKTPFEDTYADVGNNKSASEINNIFGKNIFNYTKPVDYISWLLRLHPNPNSTVLDFFAGSGTTGHAVMELNKADGGNRQFILCTNNEVSNDKEIDKLVELGHIERFDGRKRTKEHKAWLESLSCFKETETYKSFLESDENKNLGIARAVTYERLKRVINGYTTPKGKDIEGIPGNLHYYTTDFVDKAEACAEESELLHKMEVLIALEENTYCRQVVDGLVTLSSNEKQVYVYPNLYIAEKDADIIRNNLSVNKETIVYVLEGNVSDIYLSELDATIKLLPNTFYKKGELADV